MSGVGGVGNRASGGPIGASGPVGVCEGLALFDPRGSSWSLLLDLSVGALEAWPLRAGRPRPRTEVISPNELADPLDMEILEL